MPIITTSPYREPPFAATAWDPSGSKTSNSLILSNGNKTLDTMPTSGFHRAAKTVNGVTSGKYYYEITIDAISAGGNERQCSIGYGDFAHPFNPGRTGDSTNGGALLCARGPFNDTIVRDEGASLDSGLTLVTAGDVVGVRLDVDNKECEFTLNDLVISTFKPDWTGTPTLYAMASINSASSGLVILTANFGGSAFSGTVPPGFTAGFPA